MCKLRKALTLLAVLVFIGSIIAPPLRAAKRENRAKTTLLVLQRALQEYHVDQEQYVPEMEMKGADLINLLLDFGFLSAPPLNPYTGEPYRLDGTGSDRIRYHTDEAFETYSLKVLHFSSEETWLEIDSVEHHSLE